MCLALLWRENRRKADSSTSSHVGPWKDDETLLLQNSRRNSSDGSDFVGVPFDAESLHRRAFPNEHDLLSANPHDEGSDSHRSLGPLRHQVYQFIILAGLYAVHQSVVSLCTSFISTHIYSFIHKMPGRLLDSFCWCKNHPYNKAHADISYGGTNAACPWWIYSCKLLDIRFFAGMFYAPDHSLGTKRRDLILSWN